MSRGLCNTKEDKKIYASTDAFQIENIEQRNGVQPSDIRIEVQEDENSVSLLLNTILSLMEVIKSNWSERQREIIFEFEKYKGSQVECAKRLKITQSSVQRSLVNGNFYAYKSARETVKKVLEEIGKIHV